MDLVTARSYVAAIEAAAPFALTVRPWRVELTTTFQRADGLLPLWLEPDIDYPARVIRLDPSEYDRGEPPAGVVLHEVTHLVQTDVLHPHRQTPWLTEAVCDYFAASWLGSPRLWLLSPRYPELSRTLAHQLRYPGDVVSHRDFLHQLVDPLLASDLPARHPGLQDAIAAAVRAVPADSAAPHSVGQIIGGAFWDINGRLGRAVTWSTLLAALHDDPRPTTPAGWLQSWITAAGRVGREGASAVIRQVVDRRGFR